MDNIALDLGPDAGGVERGDAACCIGAGPAGRGDGAAPGHHQLRGHVRADGAGAAPAPPRRGGAVIETLREALAGERAWLVGGALRDRLLGRPTPDLDVVVDGDVRRAARSLGRGAGGASFELSDQFGAWRVVARDRSWQVDITPLQGGSLEADLARARLHGQRHGRAAGRRRARRPPRRRARPRPQAPAHGQRRRVRRRSPARAARRAPGHRARLRDRRRDRRRRPRARAGSGRYAPRSASSPSCAASSAPTRRSAASRSWTSSTSCAAVLPELAALRGVEQSPYHHLDVYGHTLEVLQASIDLERDPARGARRRGPRRAGPRAAGRAAGRRADPRRRRCASAPCCTTSPSRRPADRAAGRSHRLPRPRRAGRGDGARRAGAPARQRAAARARRGADPPPPAARASSSTSMPLDRRELYRYLSACEPVEADVTLLSAWPTGWPRAGARPTRRSPSTSSSRASCWPRRWRVVPPGRSRRWCAATSWPRELGIARGPELGELHVADRRGALRGRGLDARGGGGVR